MQRHCSSAVCSPGAAVTLLHLLNSWGPWACWAWLGRTAGQIFSGEPAACGNWKLQGRGSRCCSLVSGCSGLAFPDVAMRHSGLPWLLIPSGLVALLNQEAGFPYCAAGRDQHSPKSSVHRQLEQRHSGPHWSAVEGGHVRW